MKLMHFLTADMTLRRRGDFAHKFCWWIMQWHTANLSAARPQRDSFFLKNVVNFYCEPTMARASGVRRKFPRGPNFCHHRVTSQINLGSAKGTTIIGWSGGMPRKNFAKLHQKDAFSYRSNRKLFENQKNVCTVSNPGARGKNFQKLMFSRKKRALISSSTFFSQHHVDL